MKARPASLASSRHSSCGSWGPKPGSRSSTPHSVEEEKEGQAAPACDKSDALSRMSVGDILDDEGGLLPDFFRYCQVATSRALPSL